MKRTYILILPLDAKQANILFLFNQYRNTKRCYKRYCILYTLHRICSDRPSPLSPSPQPSHFLFVYTMSLPINLLVNGKLPNKLYFLLSFSHKNIVGKCWGKKTMSKIWRGKKYMYIYNHVHIHVCHYVQICLYLIAKKIKLLWYFLVDFLIGILQEVTEFPVFK